MKHLLSVLSLICILSACASKNSEVTSTKSDKTIDMTKSTLLYFHSNYRCATCLAVEKVAKASLAEIDSTLSFYAIDISAEENKELAKKYGVSGQSLLLVKGDKSINMTNDAFMYARSQPEKVKARIAEGLASL